MIDVPKGKSRDWYDGYTYAMSQARENIREAGDDVWEALLDAPEVRDDGLIEDLGGKNVTQEQCNED